MKDFLHEEKVAVKTRKSFRLQQQIKKSLELMLKVTQFLYLGMPLECTKDLVKCDTFLNQPSKEM